MFLSNLRVGFFLAIRQLRRSSLWTTGLIISIMILTFLNLVVISGILVGLLEGAIQNTKEHYTGDIIIITPREKTFIEGSPDIINIVNSIPEVSFISPRYTSGGIIESNYKERIKETDIPEEVSTSFAGIDPIAEDQTTGLSKLLIEGEYLDVDDFDQVIIGALLIDRYLDFESELFSTLKNVYVGSKVRIEINGAVREVTVKGILKSKVDEIDRRVFFPEKQFKNLIGQTNINEISIKLTGDADPILVKKALIASGISEKDAKVQTFEDAQPKFLKDMKATFKLLGNIISYIGLAVASITVFIVIFINALTRQKFIGILKGIGINGTAIEISYIFQSFFYAIIGAVIGFSILQIILVPYFAAHPINFTFSDGILVAPLTETLGSATLLIIITVIAGYLPSRMIIRKNTLDSILGRN